MDERDGEDQDQEVCFTDFWEFEGDEDGFQTGHRENFGFSAGCTDTQETGDSGEVGRLAEIDPAMRQNQHQKLGRRPGLLWASLAGCAVFGLIGGYLLAFSGVLHRLTSAPASSLVQVDNDAALGVVSINSSSTFPTNEDGATNVLIVDVVGDVVHPGIVRLKPDSRVLDAVAAAGGFVHPDDANEVNLASPVNDGDEVVIPTSDAQSPAREEGSAASPGQAQQVEGRAGEGSPAPAANYSPTVGQTSSLIDLNTADEATLETIPGIGPSKASAIVTYRTEHGRFGSVNDLLKIRGIGAVTLSHIAPYVTIVGGH